MTILRTLTLKNAIWPKRAAHDLIRPFCTIFMESALFSRFEENFRDDFENFEAIWPKRAAHDLKRAFHDFENFDPQKCHLAVLRMT